MGSEAEDEPSSWPQLSLYSLPLKSRDPPEMPTPPPRILASIPFGWEEAPGKPRHTAAAETLPSSMAKSTTTTSRRCLDLPPRLLVIESSKVTYTPSPSTVLDGPYVVSEGSLPHFSLSFSDKGWSFRSAEGDLGEGAMKYRKRDMMSNNRNRERRSHFRSWRWGSLDRGSGGETEFLSSTFGGGFNSDTASSVGKNVKITRSVTRRSSFMSFSATSSNLLSSIYGSFKQKVHWRRR